MSRARRALNQMQRRARREYAKTEMGRLTREVEKLSRQRSNSHAQTRIVEATNRIARLAKRHARQSVGEIDALVTEVSRYAKGTMRDRMVTTLLGQFGEVGQLVGQILSLVGSPLTAGASAAAEGARGAYSERQLAAELRSALAMVGLFQPEYLSEAGMKAAGITPEDAGFTREGPGGHTASSRHPQASDRMPEMRGRTGARGARVGPAEDGEWTTVQIGGRSRTYQNSDPIVSGEMIPVESSNVHSIGYIFNYDNPMKGIVKVRFLQKKRGSNVMGQGPLYFYHGVHPDVFEAFRKAASKGVFVWDRFRVRGTKSGHRYQYELKGITDGYVPRQAKRFGDNEYFVQRQVRAKSTRTGQTRTITSQLPDRFAGRPQRGTPDIGVPRRGTPNRGTPNRGR